MKFRRSVYITISLVGVLWTVKFVELALDSDFVGYGILPRNLVGSLGIFTSPFIHSDFTHLFANTFPLLFLGITIFYFYHRIALQVLLSIYFMTGFWVWIAGRDAYHIGASGVIYGLLSFLLVGGLVSRNRNLMAISLSILFLYGGSFFSGLFPQQHGVSWESHLLGAFAGIFCAIFFRQSKTTGAIDAASEEALPVDHTLGEDVHIHYTYKEED